MLYSSFLIIYIYIYLYLYLLYKQNLDTGRLVENPFLHAAGPPPGSSLEASISGFSVFIYFWCFGDPFWTPFWMLFFVLCLFIEFGTFDLQNDASYVGKTHSYLKLPLLKQLETSMISGSLLALFCHHFLCFPMIDFCMFSGMCFLWFILDFGLQMASQSQRRGAPFGILFRYLFDPVPKGCHWRFFCSFWFSFGSIFHGLGYLLGSILVSKTFRFDIRICEAPADYRRCSLSKNSSSLGTADWCL